jgi:hypothetical protein
MEHPDSRIFCDESDIIGCVRYVGRFLSLRVNTMIYIKYPGSWQGSVFLLRIRVNSPSRNII